MMDMGYYILDGHTAVHVVDTLVWAEWLETHIAERIVGRDHVAGIEVSTVFLGLDYNAIRKELYPDLPHVPAIFETMIFHGPHRKGGGEIGARYATWDEAEAGHAAALSRIRSAANG